MKINIIYFFCLFLLICGCTTIPSEPVEWDIESLDTGRGIDYLTANQRAFILEINKMRSDPQKYAKYNKIYLNRNAYNFLLKMEPLPSLIVAEGLSKSASDLLLAGYGEPNIIIFENRM